MDLVYRTYPQVQVDLLYFDHLVDQDKLFRDVLNPLLNVQADEMPELLSQAQFSATADSKELVLGILSGNAAIFYKQDVYLIDMFGLKSRPVSQSETETVITGPHDAFTEQAGMNLAMIRQRVKSSHLKVVAPSSFFEYFSSSDDYYPRWLLGSATRLLRFLALLITIGFTALYVSVTTFHYEMIPENLLLTLTESRSRVPFHPLTEALFLETTIELLREAGARLPTKIGQTIGIVGGIVIGQAAVQAGLTSNILIIAVAASAIASFVTPAYVMSASIRFLRFGLIILAGLWGNFGLALGITAIVIHMSGLTSLGSSYLTPVAPFRMKDWNDTFLVAPFRFLTERPTQMKSPNRVKHRMKSEGVESMQEKLSPFHLTIFIYMIQTGIVVFTLPQLLAEHFGTNGWLILIVISLIVSLNIGLMSVVFRLGNGKSMFEIMETSIPRLLLYPFYALLVCAWSMMGCLITKNYVLIFQMIAFPTTPPMQFKLAVDVFVFLLMIKSVYNISKAATVFFWMMIWMITLLFFFFGEFEWARLTPFVFQNGQPTIKGFVAVFSSFLGYELCLLLMPYCDRKTKFARSVLAGNALLTFNYLFFNIVVFGFYGYEALKNLEIPLLNILTYVQLPFIQAIENLLYGVFLFSILITTVMYLWSAKETLKRMMPASDRLLAFLLVFLVYGISYIPDTLSEVKQWLGYLSYVELALSFSLSPALLVMLLVQRRKGGVVHA